MSVSIAIGRAKRNLALTFMFLVKHFQDEIMSFKGFLIKLLPKPNILQFRYLILLIGFLFYPVKMYLEQTPYCMNDGVTPDPKYYQASPRVMVASRDTDYEDGEEMGED